MATALVGCGGDDSSSNNNGNNGNTAQKAEKPEIAIPAQGEFIDAAVEGLYYTSGNKQDFTGAEGQYDVGANAEQVTFTLGGKEGGLVIGSVSARHITTPFEAAGSYQRAVNLARLLLTINEHSDDTKIIIPDAIKAPDTEMITALQRITLDDIDTSSIELLKQLGKAASPLVSADDADKHLQDSLKHVERGSTDTLSHWAKGSNWTFVERFTTQRVRNTASSEYQIVIHADSTLGDDVFTKTRGLTGMTFTLADSDFIIRKGSNDSTVSGKYAAQYLTCVKDNGIFTWPKNNEPLCDDAPITTIADELREYAYGNQHYQHQLTSPTTISTEDEKETWTQIKEMGGAIACMADANCSEQALTKFEVIERDDSDAQDGSKRLKETTSSSYDPITDVYVETRSKEYLNGDYKGRIEEQINFLYPVDAVGQDRYVDFIGTWRSVQTLPNCDLVAIAEYTFDENGLTATGNELISKDGECSLDPYPSELTSYADLAKMDYWWFTTNAAGDSKATLDQLNTTIRWNDIDLSQGETGENYKINRFSYIPAGKNWDRGTLVRDTLDTLGNKVRTETLTKI